MTLPIIATEECYATPSWFDAFFALNVEGAEGMGVRIAQNTYKSERFNKGLADFAARLRDMDDASVTMHVLSLVTPGVQVFGATKASQMARDLNDELAKIVANNPKRFAALAAVAPQDPEAAAQEIARAKTSLKMHGVILNSYTNDEFLDLPKFEPILEAAARYKMPLYLHPRCPAPSMVTAYAAHGMDGPIWGFAADGSLHAMRLIFSGAFDRHPDLVMIVGHMGEGIPFFLWRLDNLYNLARSAGIAEKLGFKSLKKMPSEYFRSNIFITTSGMFSTPALRYCIDTLGADRIMFAIDYPFEVSRLGVKFLLEAPITEEERALIAYKTAQRVFSIDTMD